VLATGGEQGEMIVVWPDPLGPGRPARLERALARLQGSVALGPPVRTTAAARSLTAARDTLALGGRGVLGTGPWAWSDHLVELSIARAEEPLLELADRLLKPLDSEPAGSRARLVETLQALLDAGGNHSVAAHALDVHPQTVRYRLARLRELLTVDVDSPAARFELQLALRARALTAPEPEDDDASLAGAAAPGMREVSR
jgi:DNA-binding PucR family transcriptional regulator